MDLQDTIRELNRFIVEQANKARVHKCKGENVAKGKVQLKIKVTTNTPEAIVSNDPVFERAGKFHGAYAPTQYAVTYSTGRGDTAYRNKGVKKEIRRIKREQAEQRNARTRPENRRAHREGRMGAPTASKRKKVRK